MADVASTTPTNDAVDTVVDSIEEEDSVRSFTQPYTRRPVESLVFLASLRKFSS